MGDQGFSRVIFCDCETTTDSADTGYLWEVALIVRDIHDLTGGYKAHRLNDKEYLWHIRPPLHNANSVAIGPKIGDYYRRCAVSREPAGTARKITRANADPTTAAAVACEIAHLLPGCLFVAANPHFDAGFLNEFLRRNDQCPTCDYHFRDIGSLVTGYAAGVRAAGGFRAEVPRAACWPVSPKLHDMARAVGIDPGGYEAHTALGDCRLARDIHDRVMGGAR